VLGFRATVTCAETALSAPVAPIRFELAVPGRCLSADRPYEQLGEVGLLGQRVGEQAAGVLVRGEGFSDQIAPRSSVQVGDELSFGSASSEC